MTGYVVCGLGAVGVRVAGTVLTSLSPARRRLLAILIAAGPRGIDGDDLAEQLNGGAGMSAAALRMAAARLRKVLPEGALPESRHGRYSLRLPVESVDIWHLVHLATSKSVAGLDPQVVDHLLSYDPVLADVGESEILETCRYSVRVAQRTLIRQISAEGQPVLSSRLVPHLEAHASEDPWNENLAYVLASAKAGLGDRRGALSVLAETRTRMVSAGLDLSEELNQLEVSLLDGKPPRLWLADEAVSVSAVSVSAASPHPVPERHIGLDDLLERAAKLFQGCEPSHTLLLRGESGSGLTTALDAIEQVAVGSGWRVARLSPSRHARAALGPILAVFPSLYDEVRTILSLDEDAELRQARLWVAVRSVLVSGDTGEVDSEPGDSVAPLAIFVDDAQWLDSYSRQFLTHLVASPSDGRIALVIAGKSDEASLVARSELDREATLRQAVVYDLAAFGPPEMTMFVQSRFPGVSANDVDQIADALLKRSGGLPGVAEAILGFSPPAAEGLPGAHSLATWGDARAELDTDLTPAMVRLGVAAVVLARPGALRELARVARLSVAEAKSAADELVARRVLKTVGTAEYSVANTLVAAKLLSTQSKTGLMYFHAAAAGCGGGSHEFARHARAAIPIVGRGEAAAALLNSARELFRDGLFEESAGAFAEAEGLDGAEWSPTDHVQYVRALDLSGRHDEAQRRRILLADRWLGMERFHDAFELAICGLPEAEPIDGSPSIVRILADIDPERLPPTDRFSYYLQFSRQSAIVGQVTDGVELSEVAMRAARSAEERLSATLNRRFVRSATVAADERLRVLGAVDDSDIESVDLRAQYYLVRAIDEFELGDLAKAADSINGLTALPGLSVVRRWHSLLFQATLAIETGARDEGDALRRAALDLALTAGLAEADNAYLISLFSDLFAEGTAGLLIDGVDNGAIPADTNVLTRAAVAAILLSAGRHDEAVDHAERVATAVVDSPVSQGASALALSAEALSHSVDGELRNKAFDLLHARGNTLLLVGAGAACLGPVRQHAAWLAPNQAAADDCRAQARDLVDAVGVFRWLT